MSRNPRGRTSDTRAREADSGERDPRTRDRILHAAAEWAAETGLGKLSMDDIAARAGLARATLYLHFPGRQALIGAAVRLELDRFFAELSEATAGDASVEQRVVHGFAQAHRMLRRHRTLESVLRLNPQILLPYIFGEAPAIARGRHEIVGWARPQDLRADVTPEEFAEFAVRLHHTFILAPSSVFDLDSPGGAEDFARRFLLPLLRSGSDAPQPS
ncbi:TetR/AcrR family transcriptional regulator [Nocardia sp. NBC_00511]|uniref:TetR/AcrR family transcriptional regulator n=1 Tax=Nocardia sp. NBC_00511 TaxID=2903591 RepID=UPI0030E355B8